MDFKERLKIERGKKGWKQEDLAKAAEVSVTQISFLENGKHQPNAIIANRLANALKITPEYLLYGHQITDHVCGHNENNE